MYNKNYKNLFFLRNNFKLLYFKFLIENSTFIIFFNYNKISNLNLLNLKNEISKKNLKNIIINSKFIKSLFNKDFQFLNSNILFVFFNDIEN